jgi:formylglycine-generating enzyme required for sulfatase activity
MGLLSFFSKRAPSEEERDERPAPRVDAAQLRQLALADPAEEVRQAAVRALPIQDQRTFSEVVRTGRHLDTRAMALARLAEPERRIAVVLDGMMPDALRTQALVGLGPDRRLCEIYRPNASTVFKNALFDVLERLDDDVFWAEVARTEPEVNLRARVIGHIKSEKVCASLYRTEPDANLRRMLTDLVRTPEGLASLIEVVATQEERVRLIGRIVDPAFLKHLVLHERNLESRLEALGRLGPPEMVCEIAAADVPAPVAAEALARLRDDEERGVVAMRSPHEEIRAEALRLITDEDVLSRLEDEAAAPEIRWLAGRRLGSVPTKELAGIKNGATLRRLIELETEPEVSAWLVGRVKDIETLRALGGTAFPGTAAAQRRLKEREGPLGIRFMLVPGRPYEMSLFPITIRQVREALGPDAVGKGGDELPAAGVTPEVATRFCEFLNTRGVGHHRLPSFEEWRHACLTDDSHWLDVAAEQFSWAEALMGTRRLAFGAKSRRSVAMAWPNPWGFLDMVGNVAVWVDDSPRHKLHLAVDDPLALGGDPASPAAFAVAAGVSWADPRVKKDNLERLVARSALSGWAADKVGFRVVCEAPEKALRGAAPSKFKVVLLPQTAPGVTKERVMAALAGCWPEAADRAAAWYRVAPTVVLPGGAYTEARRVKRLLEGCGACVQLGPA